MTTTGLLLIAGGWLVAALLGVWIFRYLLAPEPTQDEHETSSINRIG